jgi:CheY-like chemotaxis protein
MVALAAQTDSSQQRPPLNVLVSDIRDQFADALDVLLGPHGFTITRVRSGDEAIWTVEHRPIDAAVIESDLPDMPGVRVVRTIRTVRAMLPVILVGREAGDPAQQHLLRAGLELEALSVLAQPVDLELMLGQMARLFEKFLNVRVRPLSPEPAGDEYDDDEVDAVPPGAGPVEPMREPGRRGPKDKTLRFRKRD